MAITTERTLDRLCIEETCLGVVCSTFTFDPLFFEEHFLRTVLRLSSDPTEQTQRYFTEALRGLQETPVVVFVDAGQCQAGRRLPYDLLKIQRTTVFHPKSVLLLYEKSARLMIGSGNLTACGYSQNTELFIALDLHYEDEQEAALLRSFDEHLEGISRHSRHTGSQFKLVRDELNRRLHKTQKNSKPATFALLDSLHEPIVDQIIRLLPEQAEITSLGMVAPFYELDDGGELDSTSVFGAFKSRASTDVTLDVAVYWENPQTQPASGDVKLKDGLKQLWAWRTGENKNASIEYLVPTELKNAQSSMKYIDHRGNSKHWDLQETLDAVESRELWKLPQPVAYAPRMSLLAATSVYTRIRLWLHPAARLNEGRVEQRPLHAKLLLVSFRSGSVLQTLVVMGSANMSRRALLQNVSEGGNVELGIAFIVHGECRLTDFLPELVCVPMDLLELKEQAFPEVTTNWATAVEQATHDPAQRTLTVSWSDLAAELPSWQLLYQDRELSASETPPEVSSSFTIPDFTLQATTAELVLRVADQNYSVPILVTDLVALPVTEGGYNLGLNDLLLLLGRRIGREQAIHRAYSRTTNGTSELDAVFGEGFTPTDVFRAWWRVAEELKVQSLSVNAFRLLLEGSLSVGSAWKCLAESSNTGSMDSTAVWFYGVELLRELEQVELDETPDRPAKVAILDAFRKRVRDEIKPIAPKHGSAKWVNAVRKFYAGAIQ